MNFKRFDSLMKILAPKLNLTLDELKQWKYQQVLHALRYMGMLEPNFKVF